MKIRCFIFIIVGWVFLSLPLLGNSKKCGTVTFGGLDWESSQFHVAVAKIILTHGYGCKVSVIPGTTLPMLQALAMGDIDILMEIWKNNILDVWTQFEKEGKVVDAGINFPDAVQGFYVPTYLVKGPDAKAPGLKSVFDLPKYKRLFQDPESPDKGRFLNCILGWSCEDVNTKKLKAYGLLKDFVNFRPGTGAALDAEIASRYEKREPFVTYYWGPTWILGKYDLTLLKEPAYNPKIWKAFLESKDPKQATAYPVIKVHIGVNKKFSERNPLVMDFLGNYITSNRQVSEALAYIWQKKGRTAEDAAIHFLNKNTDLWASWVSPAAFEQIHDFLTMNQTVQKKDQIDFSTPINDGVLWVVKKYGAFFKKISKPVLYFILSVEAFFKFLPWWGLMLMIGGIAYIGTRKFYLSGGVMLCLFLIWGLGIWELAIQTLALMLISTAICVIFGLPLGIFTSKYDRFRSFMLPILDGMQTMPSFVYLIPALMLFGLGKVPAVFATVIYAIPPIIRLTDLGIRRVNPAVVEAAEAFGANRKQLLWGVELPLALPTLMAGINQTTMLALSMVVIASMIGSRGLGEQVLLGIQKLDVGKGFIAGLGIVLLAIVLDRITQGIGRRMDKTHA